MNEDSGLLKRLSGQFRRSLWLYAAQGLRGSNHGFWVSEDAGRTWTRTLRESLGTLAVDPSDFRHVLAGTHSSDALGLFESRDAGRTWKRHAAPTSWASNSSSIGFLFHPASGRGDAKTWLVHNAGLWRTADAGATWTKVGDEPLSGGIGDGLGAVYTSDGTLYKMADARLLRSRDNGAAWERVEAKLPYSGYRAIASDGRHLHLAPDGYPPESGWLRSEETDGATWIEPPGSPRPERGPLRMRFDPERRILYSANWSAGLWALRVPD